LSALHYDMPVARPYDGWKSNFDLDRLWEGAGGFDSMGMIVEDATITLIAYQFYFLFTNSILKLIIISFINIV
jgi:hypothetical protein